MKLKNKRHIQSIYRKQLQEKKEFERDFVIFLILMLIIGGVIIIDSYIGDPFR